MRWKNVKKVVSKLFFWARLSGLVSGLAALIVIIKFFGEIVRWLVSKSIIVWGILNQPVPINVVLVIFALIFIIFLIIKSRKTRLDEKDVFILGILDEREIRLSLLFKIYKQRFEAEPRTMSNCLVTIKQLEKKKLIECEVFTGGAKDIQEEMFKLTKKGQKRFEKLVPVIKKNAENIYNKVLAMPKMKVGSSELKRIEPHKEIIFILELLANQQNKSMTKTDLRNYYFKKFSNKKIIDFNIVWNRLETGNLIMEYRASPGYGSLDIYYMTDNGLVYHRTYRNNN